ncbi:putative zinc finger zz-type protein [Diplodia seriata]|uniref:Putative zinc finger zz-type protein n=1 Tax=Diplodia seriata TaxID=420778 RepID=A0A0G2G6L1_9PEZI|nr:putative zinc finger zz-type protein [Diplodia seriata]
MPTLKQLTCTLEKEPSRSPLKEFSTNYSDGFVETYVAVPIERTGFGIHLKSSGYIAPGLAMFVYIDGVYQCNRHRQNLIPPDGTVPSDFYETNFRVLQKEEKTGKGQFIGRAWSFDGLIIATADKAPNVDDTILGNLGTIEVVVLRIHPLSADQPAPAGMAALLPARPTNATKAKPTSEKTAKQKVIKIKPKFVPDENGKFDGAADDAPVQNFGAGLDGPSDDRYYYHDQDDRGRRPRHSHHRRASPSPPPRHDFGPSYADYLRWRDTHPDAAVPSRGPVMQRSSSYYEQYRPTSGAHGQHGNASSGHRQRRRVRADDGIPLDRPYEYWVFEGSNLLIGDRFPHPAHEDPPPLSASYLTQSEYESQAKSEAERRPRTSGDARAGAYSAIDTRKLPQARASDQIPNRQTGKFSSYRAGQADSTLASSSRPDPIYNTRRAPETNRRDDNCKMSGSWVGQDPKDSARTPTPTLTPNPFYGLPVHKKQQQSGSRSNKGGSTIAFHKSSNEQAGLFNGQDTTGWGADAWDSNGAAQGGDGSKAAGDGGWGSTDPQEQPNQPAKLNFGGAQQGTGASGNWQNDAGNTGGDAGSNKAGSSAANPKWGNDNTGGGISFEPATADNSADNTGAVWNNDTTTPAANDAQAKASNWDTPATNDAQQATADSNWPTTADNAQQAPADNKWDCGAIPTPTAHVEQFPAVTKSVRSHKAASSSANTSMHKPIVPEQPLVKSYWQKTAPRGPVPTPYRQPKSSPDAPTEVFAPSEAPYVVPEHTTREKLVDSYVHHGKAYGYAHATARPNYMDTLDQPYAVFRFKYRSGEMLARILGRKGKEEIEKERAREREEERKRKLSLLSKEELIAQLVEKKEAEAKAASEKKATTAGGSQKWKAPSVAASQPKPIHEWVNDVVDATGSVGKASAAKSTSGSSGPPVCKRCETVLINEWWSCGKCIPDDTYDICIHCVETKKRCDDSSHDLMKWRDGVASFNGVKTAGPVNETLRGIQKGSKSTKGGNGGGSKKNGGGGNNTAKDDSNNWSGGFGGATGDWAGTTPVVADTTSGDAWGAVDTNIKMAWD